MAAMDWCERCGADLEPFATGLPCRYCWEGRADDPSVAELAAEASEALVAVRTVLSDVPDPSGRENFARAMASDDPVTEQAGNVARGHEIRARAALELLSQVDDPNGAAPLRRLVRGHTEPRVRAAALRSLAWSGDGSDVPLLVRALDAADKRERQAAIAGLGELGGSVAADALAARLQLVADDELEQVVAALAWLRDRRALESARRLGACQRSSRCCPGWWGRFGYGDWLCADG